MAICHSCSTPAHLWLLNEEACCAADTHLPITVLLVLLLPVSAGQHLPGVDDEVVLLCQVSTCHMPGRPRHAIGTQHPDYGMIHNKFHFFCFCTYFCFLVLKTHQKFTLAPMGVLAPWSAHARPSAQPPIDTIGNFPGHMSAESPSNISPNPSEVISEVSEP